jgi:hypothetical protein
MGIDNLSPSKSRHNQEVTAMSAPNVPAPVSAFIEASNRFDLEALMATFETNAMVNDHRCEFAGNAAIRAWAAKEIVGDRVTMSVIDTRCYGDSVAVNANIAGDFDKTGLPDPLMLTYYFSVSGPRIEQLIIVMNK